MASVMLKVTNNGGGVKELRVLQNGKSQPVDYSDLKTDDQSRAECNEDI